MTLLKWCFVLMVLGVVVCAACGQGECSWTVAMFALEGFVAGTGYGLVVVIHTIERVRNPYTITAWRVRKLIAHDAKVGLITGLLLGVTNAILVLLK